MYGGEWCIYFGYSTHSCTVVAVVFVFVFVAVTVAVMSCHYGTVPD